MATYYVSNWTVRDTLGRVVPNASVYWCTQPATTNVVPPSPLATIYNDSNGDVIITNPQVTNGFGQVSAYIASGAYTVVEVWNGAVRAIYPDQQTGLITAQTAPAGQFFNSISSAGVFGSAVVTLDQVANPVADWLVHCGDFSVNVFGNTDMIWALTSTIAATGSANVSSPTFQIEGDFWAGFSPGVDSWSFQDVLGVGTNPTSTLSITHSGTTGASQVGVPALVLSASTPTVATGYLALGKSSATVSNATPVTATAPTACSPGPTTPQVIAGYIEMNLGGTPIWVPYCV